MFSKLLPKETGFFDYFEEISTLANEACKQLLAMATDGGDHAIQANRIKDIEREADKATYRCIEALHKTFITPIDRSEIHTLTKRLDDIIDSVDSTASRIVLYELKEIRPEAKALSDVLVRATEAIGKAVRGLRDMKNAEQIKEQCSAIYQMENEGDTLLRLALVRLFQEKDQPILVIKWKEIYERLEKATDRCESVASLIQGIVIEAS
jgi:uncharacterized protein